ncbi:MAG TPA: hypothetical protein VK059_14895 [Nocardioidaceae bacterium]|nr:hypothetical protein [Nocardioidaceae bacterium]
MSTDIERYEPRDEVAMADPTGGRLVSWAQAMSAAHKLGTALCQTAFVPAAFKGNPDDAAAAIMYGDEIGFTPGQSLQNIYVISGKPALYARAMVALVLSHGHKIWTEVSSPQRVIVCGQRRGSDKIERVEWTTSKAQQAGYTSNKKYTTDPESMLYARASGDVARRVAPDALAGIAYSVEEMELTDTEVTVSQVEAPKRTAKRASAPAPVAEEPELDEPAGTTPVDADAPSAADPDSITSQQTKKLGALTRELGLTDRADALDYVAQVIGREVSSRNELTKNEASDVIDKLQSDVTTTDATEADLAQQEIGGEG